jgi:hypothetical protein
MSTYTPIATQTLGSAAASVTFSSIPQGYTDLVLIVNGGQSVATANGGLQFNGDTGSNYSTTYLRGNGTSATSTRASNETLTRIDGLGWPTSNNANSIVQIQNYSNTTTYKTVLTRYNAAVYGTEAIVGLWRSTSAINQIVVKSEAYNWTSGSTFSLYGIQVGNAAQKAQGGNIVTSDGTYVYHTFTSSGSFIPNQALTVDYLVVAGGGGGASNDGGGGGAGGMRCTVTGTGGSGSLETALSLSSGLSYPVIIGAGGSGGTSSTTASSGSNSVFGSITSTGGGRSGNGSYAPLTGGSGGGGGFDDAGAYYVGAAASPAGQGFAGGNGKIFGASNAGGGGGGGASAVGTNAVSPNAGSGGAGRATSISGTSVTYAGGGGAGSHPNANPGTGGAGGGGDGGDNQVGVATSGTANLGGGGGGGAESNTISVSGGNGGSGIVIIRYAL